MYLYVQQQRNIHTPAIKITFNTHEYTKLNDIELNVIWSIGRANAIIIIKKQHKFNYQKPHKFTHLNNKLRQVWQIMKKRNGKEIF